MLSLEEVSTLLKEEAPLLVGITRRLEEGVALLGVVLLREEVTLPMEEGAVLLMEEVSVPLEPEQAPAMMEEKLPALPEGVTPLLEEVSALLKEKALLLKGAASRLEEVPA